MIQIVSLSKGQVLPKHEIQRIVNSARGTFNYAKFNLSNGIYITITYNRDLSISVSTNTRDQQFYYEMLSLQRIYTQMRVVEFLFRWINKLNK